ncbi:Uncharacterised protein [Burkholderia pseudomallei]|nr:Uncharacterised protein [Burkholderia pseudomallei]VCE52130.1 Uncharacterised protein [Burkholderia pseudomallei]VCE52802.1 Uncharacterised protein [Burkholderia pseudomallei]VCE89506.1 Uncharacterised protein [Burkholderia pseudomallei]
MRGIEVARRVIGDARDHEPAVAVVERPMLVEQHVEAETAELGDPLVGARIVLVVARHDECAVARAQPPERRRMAGQLRDRAVDDVTRHRDEIRREPVDRVDDRLHVAALDRRADMDVADLHDREAVERGGQIVDRHRDVDDACAASRIDEADDAHRERRERHAGRRLYPPLRERHRAGRERVDGDERGEQHVAREREHEQRREEAHREEAGPGDAIAERLPLEHARQHAERNQQARPDEPQRARVARGGRGELGQQTEADVHVQQHADDRQAQQKR